MCLKEYLPYSTRITRFPDILPSEAAEASDDDDDDSEEES
jgi:hypothetical protein